MLRPHLIAHFGRLLSSDIAPALRGGALAGEEYVCCDLADGTAVDRLVRRAAAVLHFGGISKEDTFARILQSNILGTYNVFEAARQHGKKRIVYASSSHVIGFHDVGHTLDALSPLRPDTYYGVSKAFGESLASLYVDKHGMDIASLRIGKCVPAPKPGSPRDLSIWLAPDDLVALVVACFAAPKLGHAVLYGVSRSSRAWWDNSRTPQVLFQPQASADDHAPSTAAAPETQAQTLAPAQRPEARFQGGGFCKIGYDAKL
eukprot:TRINITY_DN349_c0_g1_i1.p1 TRINITY_DN349_c0_g1~~TRINITY_DN349_c0_g1_i1.p1  ORF type:complete len:286 (+),score=43.60 TRINITY_DN349_c0_g1_i1:80-859(+)